MVGFLPSPCFLPNTPAALSDPREGLGVGVGGEVKGIRKVLLHSPFLERFYLLQASRWLWDLCMGSLETYNFGLSPAVPFSWLKFLLSGVAHFLHCP